MQRKFRTVYLENFKGGLHLARGLSNTYDKSLDVLHSDTLKSAIFAMSLQLYPELGSEENGFSAGENFMKAFKVSSAFPFFKTKEGRRLHFFPKPLIPTLRFSIDGETDGKEKLLKRLRYLEQSLFEGVLKNRAEDFSLQKQSIQGSFAAASDLDFTGALKMVNCDALIRSEVHQHVHIPKDFSADSEPYVVDKIFFHKNAGLYFLLEVEDSSVGDKVRAAMTLLQDSGIGTDRNTGNGQFEVSFGELTLEVPEEGELDLALSLYCPEKEEIEKDVVNSFYGLTKRGGYISSPASVEHQTIRKKSIYMFVEGSAFPSAKDSVREGKVVDLKPYFEGLNHPIWRDGRSIFVPMLSPK